MKKILAFLLAVMMVLAFAACGEDNGGTPTPTPDVKGMSADVLPRNAMTPSVEIPADFKIGMICLHDENSTCLLYTSPSPRDRQKSRMPSSA